MNKADGSSLPDLVRSLADVLVARGWKLAVAESCTGGGLGAALTDLAGSSSFFLGGVIAYDNRVKARWLDVPEDVLRGEGAVSREVAERMADGCRRRLAADLAVAITGIAGPGGATSTKPVGLVFIATSTSSGTRSAEHHFPGGRAAVRRAAVAAALRSAIEAAS